MLKPRSSQYINGVLLIFFYLLLIGAFDVLLGHLTQAFDPIKLVFWSTSITVLFYSVLNIFNVKTIIKKMDNNKLNIFALNLSTAVSWISFFMTLKYLEPLIVATLSTAIGPIMTVFLYKYFRKNVAPNFSEKFSSILIFIVLLYIIFLNYRGLSALGKIDNHSILLGLGFSFLCGIASILNLVFSKKLHEKEFTSRDIMTLRFYLLLGGSLVYLFVNQNIVPDSHNEILVFFVIAFGSTIPGLYMLQLGIERIEPITVSFLLTLGPLATLPFQIFDPRLSFSINSFLSSFIIICLTLFAIYSRRYSIQGEKK